MVNNILKNNIFSIVVCFNTDLKNFEKILKLHLKNFTNIILINNSQSIPLISYKSSQVSVVTNSKNIGLAAALNVGILEAKKQGAKMVALFDQDTLLPKDFSKNILKFIDVYHGQKKPALFYSLR